MGPFKSRADSSVLACCHGVECSLAEAGPVTIRGELAVWHGRSPGTLVFGRSLRSGPMMQSCASLAQLRGGGPILITAGWPCSGSGCHHLGSLSAVGGRSSITSLVFASRGRAKDDPLRQVPGRCQTPQSNEQLPRQSDNQGLARGSPAIGGSGPVPARQITVGLEPQKSPGELEHAATNASIAHPRQALLPALGPTLVRRPVRPA
jgi:hypothetical protein